MYRSSWNKFYLFCFGFSNTVSNILSIDTILRRTDDGTLSITNLGGTKGTLAANVNENSDTATTSGHIGQSGNVSGPMTFNWAGQNGQPPGYGVDLMAEICMYIILLIFQLQPLQHY